MATDQHVHNQKGHTKSPEWRYERTKMAAQSQPSGTKIAKERNGECENDTFVFVHGR